MASLLAGCPSPPPTAPLVIPEKGVVGGYHLGGSRAAALLACPPRHWIQLPLGDKLSGVGLEYAGTCLVPPEPMYLLVEQVHPLFCEEELCAVMFLAAPLDLMKTAAEILTALRDRFGVPQGDPPPPECAEDAPTLAECLKSGRATVRQVWKTPDGAHVMLVIDASARHPIGLTYATERGMERLVRAGAGRGP